MMMTMKMRIIIFATLAHWTLETYEQLEICKCDVRTKLVGGLELVLVYTAFTRESI